MKKNGIIVAILLVMLTLNFFSCGSNADELRGKFSEYTPDQQVVAVLDDTEFYFADHTLKVRELVPQEEPNNGYLFWNGKLYFSSTAKQGATDFSLFVYECDTDGNHKKIIFQKDGYKTKPWATGKQGVLYVEYYDATTFDASSRKIDAYRVHDGVYKTVATGADASLADYEADTKGIYTCAFDGDVLTVTNTQSNAVYSVDDQMLRNSEFGEALADLDYTFHTWNGTDDDCVYLLYRISGSSVPYPHFVCKYLPKTTEVKFVSFFLANDVENICVDKVK